MVSKRAEFYDKEDGHLVGVRNWYKVSKDELKPNEEVVYKIHEHAGETKEFPSTDFIVKAEGYDNPEEGGMFAGLIRDLKKVEQEAKNVTKTLNELRNDTHDIINNSIN